MKMPEVGELWSDEIAWATRRRQRLLLVTDIDGEVVRGKPVTGDGSGATGVPIADFRRTWTWQGYWSMKHEVLPRLTPPYEGHLLQRVAKSRNAERLHGTADLVNSIIPSLSPAHVQAYDRERRPVYGAELEKPVSAIPAGIAYLRLEFHAPRLVSRGTLTDRPPNLLELWYQKQASAWWLVRSLMVDSPHLLAELRRG